MINLVVGATGFIGSHFCKLFNENVIPVLREDFRSNRVLTNVQSRIDLDLTGRINTVIYLAGTAHYAEQKNYRKILDFDVLATKDFINECIEHKVKRIVYLSSINVYDTMYNVQPFSIRDIPIPSNIKGFSCLIVENKLLHHASKHEIEVVIVRTPMVYGVNAPGNFNKMVNIVRRLPLLPFGCLANKRSFINVDNLCDFLFLCSIHPNAAGHTFLASDGKTVSIKEFTDAIAKGLGKKIFQLPVPVTLMRLVGKLSGKSTMIEQLYGNLEVDSSNIKEILGWTPPFTMEQSMAFLRDTDK